MFAFYLLLDQNPWGEMVHQFLSFYPITAYWDIFSSAIWSLFVRSKLVTSLFLLIFLNLKTWTILLSQQDLSSNQPEGFFSRMFLLPKPICLFFFFSCKITKPKRNKLQAILTSKMMMKWRVQNMYNL